MNLIGARLHFAGAGVDQLANIVSRVRAAAGKMTHFARHHRKTFPLLARACRLNRSVQRQNIGLEGDVIDKRGNRANALGTVGNVIHGFHHGLHHGAPLRGRAAGGHR